jgi:hypothetical protein
MSIKKQIFQNIILIFYIIFFPLILIFYLLLLPFLLINYIYIHYEENKNKNLDEFNEIIYV